MSDLNIIQRDLQRELRNKALDRTFSQCIFKMAKMVQHISDRLFPFRIDPPEESNAIAAEAAEAIKQFQNQVQSEKEESRKEIDAMAADIVQALKHFQSQVKYEMSRFINARAVLPSLPVDKRTFSSVNAVPHTSRTSEESVLQTFAQFFDLSIFRPLLMTHKRDPTHPSWLSQPSLTNISISLESLCTSYEFLNSTIDEIEDSIAAAAQSLEDMPISFKIMAHKCQAAMASIATIGLLKEQVPPLTTQINENHKPTLDLPMPATRKIDLKAATILPSTVDCQALASKRVRNVAAHIEVATPAPIIYTEPLIEPPRRPLRRIQTTPAPSTEPGPDSSAFVFPILEHSYDSDVEEIAAESQRKRSKATKIVKKIFGKVRPRKSSSSDAESNPKHQLSRSFPIPTNYNITDEFKTKHPASSSFPLPNQNTASGMPHVHSSSSSSSFSSNASASGLLIDPCVPTLIRKDHHAITRARRGSKPYSLCLSDCAEEPDSIDGSDSASKPPSTAQQTPITAVPMPVTAVPLLITNVPLSSSPGSPTIADPVYDSASDALHPLHRTETAPAQILSTHHAANAVDVGGFDPRDPRVARRRQQQQQLQQQQQRELAARPELKRNKSEMAVRARQLTL